MLQLYNILTMNIYKTIIAIRIQLGWVKREEGSEMPDQHKTKK